jgi:tripartite-type tricarboxylate transporter receptor subunit TctC
MTAIISALIALALLVIGPFPVTTATGYPDRPILILVPYPPGGATDIVTRAVATAMQSLIGTPIAVENRAGRDGLLALQALGKAAPDGYTLMVGNPTTNAVNPVLHPGQLGFDYDKGVVPISVMSEIPNAMLVTASFPASTFQEFVDHARRNPGRLKYGAPGVGAGEHLNGFAFGKAAGLDMVFQPHDGGALEAVADLMAGKFDWAMINVASTAPLIRGGKLKALAVSGRLRVPDFPDVPTIDEAGYPGIFGNAWQGLFAPGGTPPEVVRMLHKAVVQAVNTEAVKDALRKRGIVIVTSESPEAFATALKAEMAVRAEALADAKVSVD